MVSLRIDIQKHTRGKKYFKMNNSLLESEEYSDIIRATIKNTLLTYALPVYAEECIQHNPHNVDVNVSWSLFWETVIMNMPLCHLRFTEAHVNDWKSRT